MLTSLTIKNYILINDLKVGFGTGMSVITGETGAGKSILLGALGLVTGSRADSAALLDKSQKCIVEAEFDIRGYDTGSYFERHNLDREPQTLLRREINPAGKSRAFVNDTPVTLAVMKELGSILVDVHSQHETLTLGHSAFQLSLLDLYAGHTERVAKFEHAYDVYTQVSSELERLRSAREKEKQDADYLQFQYDELSTASLTPGEQEKLEEQLRILEHAAEIKSGLQETGNLLDGPESGITDQVRQAAERLLTLAQYHGELSELAGRLKSASIELQDIAGDLSHIDDSIQHEPGQAEVAGTRLDEIIRLQQKHRLESVDALIELRDSLHEKLDRVANNEDIELLKHSLEEKRSVLATESGMIRKGRLAAAAKIGQETGKLLADTGIPHGRLKIEVKPLPEGTYTRGGADQVRYLFSANKGVDYAPLNKVASGGELSRLMLCLKSLVARLKAMPTLVFDEIDSGVSGEVAFRIGNIARRISEKHQVVAITHLPQMAGKGDAHYLVFKETGGQKPATRIRRLAADERVREIARMIGGNNPSKTALENAREMLGEI